MIETKEQYEQAQFVGDRKFAHKVMDGQGLAWTVEAIFDLRETIEALREVARAAKALSNDVREAFPEGLDGLEGLGDYVIALDKATEDLPDWLIEE